MRGAVGWWDRLVVLLLGGGLLAGGLALLELRYEVLRTWPSVLVVDRARELLDQPWAYAALAAVGVVLAVIGLMWLWAHVPRRAASRVRLAASDPTGRLDVDLDALADAVAARAEAGTNLASVSASTRTRGWFSLVEVSGRLRPGTDPAALVDAATQISEDLAAAFPDDGVTGRLMVSAPARRTRTSGSGATVVEDSTDDSTEDSIEESARG
ncbi:hypothetical protein KLP28_11900 [Nocardioidaceae bacterium]|nr:hypothetical protein KLP28_11900 [Nocardioidaceae bacterium]